MPSKGKHKNRGYVVGPHSFVKVNIIIKGEKYVEPITFRGEDLETQSNLLLNKALFPISLTPSDTSDASTNISVTAEGTVSKLRSEGLVCEFFLTLSFAYLFRIYRKRTFCFLFRPFSSSCEASSFLVFFIFRWFVSPRKSQSLSTW